VTDIAAKTPLKPRRWELIFLLGPIALFLGAMAFGFLEVHSSTDTWIGLAAGRQILTSTEFPTSDTFSFTFHGETWYNQNWLTHLYQYWLYSHISPNSVIYGAWALAGSVFLFTLFGAYWRSGTWIGALICAGIVGIGGRDFLSARPATTGYFCIAALWALICAVEGQREKRRWWPIALLLPLLLIWGNAHGSFIFGYGVLTLYVGHWFVVRTLNFTHSWAYSLGAVLMVLMIGGVIYCLAPESANAKPEEIVELGTVTYYRTKLALVCCALAGYVVYWLCIRFFKPRPAVSDRQIAGVVGVIVVALILTIAIGPFHLDNFTHGEKIASSSVFRQVSEWNPPFNRNRDGSITLTPDISNRNFPPMARFWRIFSWTVGALFASLLFFVTARLAKLKPPENQPGLHTSLFDVALIIIGICMTFWARRFAPIFYIFAFPVFLVWFVNLTRMLPGIVRRYGKYAVCIAAGIGAYYVINGNWNKTKHNLIDVFEQKPQFNLLERVTRYDMTPHDTILFLRKNELDVNIVTEWTQAGPVMFHAPRAKVFMDGRAQQVYDEEHYIAYSQLLIWANTPPQTRIALLDEHGADAILLRRMKTVASFRSTLDQSDEWIPVLISFRDTLYLLKDSPGFRRLGKLLREGQEWRPKTATALAARGFVWAALEPPETEAAIDCWSRALRQDITSGIFVFRSLTEKLLETGRDEEARQMVEGYYRVLNKAAASMPENMRGALLNELSECWRLVGAARRDSASKQGNPVEQGTDE